MDYSQQWQPRTDHLLDEAFRQYHDGTESNLHYFIDDQVSGLSHGNFRVPASEETGNPVMHEVLRKTLPDRLKGFDPEKTKIRLEWRRG